MNKNRRTPRKTTYAAQAANTIYRFSKDQIYKPLAARYSGPQGMAKMARDVALLKGVINTEDKNATLLNGYTTVNQTTPLILECPTVAQGVTNSTRIGDSVKINRIDLLLQFAFTSGTQTSTSYTDQVYKWWVLRYLKTPSSSGTTAFNISDFLDVDFYSHYTPASFPNTNTNEDFQIMMQGEFTARLFPTSACQTECYKVETYSHVCSFHQTYNGANADDIVDNMCFFVCVALNPSNTGGVSTVAPQLRFWYIDN